MDILQKRISEMEALGHSPSRYRTFNRLERARIFMNKWTYNNELTNRLPSNTIERVPQKESIIAEDVVYSMFLSGKDHLDKLAVDEAKSEVTVARRLDRIFRTGYDSQLEGMLKPIFQGYITLTTNQINKDMLSEAKKTYKKAVLTARQFSIDVKDELEDTGRYLIKGYTTRIKNAIDRGHRVNADNTYEWQVSTAEEFEISADDEISKAKKMIDLNNKSGMF